MKEKYNISPQDLLSTNKGEPECLKTRKWLHELAESGKWSEVPPIYVVIYNGDYLVLDGNNRRDVAELLGLKIPQVIVIESDQDLLKVKKSIGLCYTKITNTD